MKIRIGVFFGGRSVEHEVSVISAMQTIAALDREKYDVIPVYITKDDKFYTGKHLADVEAFRDIPKALSAAQCVLLTREQNVAKLIAYPKKGFGSGLVGEVDVALPVVHGTNVEDGALQGVLEYLGIPYASCDVAASAAGMDKWIMKALFAAAGVPSLPCIKISKTVFYQNMDAAIDSVERQIGFPAVVKPHNLGSSVGISKARDREQLTDALELALSFSPFAICEKAVEPLREINCAVLGDSDGARASCCEEPLMEDDILSYSDKYQRGGKGNKGGKSSGAKIPGGKGMASLSRVIPADIPDALTEKIQQTAVAAFQAIDASGVARVDFLYDTINEQIYVNEINTIPGSLAFYLWEKSGLSFTALLDELISLAFKRHRARAKLHYSFEANLLKTAIIPKETKN